VETIDVTGSAAIESGQVFFRSIAQLESGQQITRKIIVRAHKPGSHPFRVVMRCADPDTRLGAEETTTFFVRPVAGQAAAGPAVNSETPLPAVGIQPAGRDPRELRRSRAVLPQPVRIFVRG
jgi:hypothetical protein